MNKKYYRYFGGLLTVQEKWLNKMGKKGCRLIRTGKLLYEFDCRSTDEVQYCVDFIGEKSTQHAEEYRDLLEDMGYRVFYKPINLNYSFGKIRWRPWANAGGRIASNSTTFNKEILIIEKDSDRIPWEIHTTFEDKLNYIRSIKNSWLFAFVAFGVGALLSRLWVFGCMAIIALFPVIVYQAEMYRLKKQLEIKEW